MLRVTIFGLQLAISVLTTNLFWQPMEVLSWLLGREKHICYFQIADRRQALYIYDTWKQYLGHFVSLVVEGEPAVHKRLQQKGQHRLAASPNMADIEGIITI